MKLGAFLKARWQHSRNIRRSRAEIDALQLKKFRRLVAYANEHSPYYRELIAARGINVDDCVPTHFPPITKQEVVDNFDRIVTDRRITSEGVNHFLRTSTDPTERFLGEFTVVHTAGITGRMVAFFTYSPAEWAVGAALALRIWPFSWRRRRMAYFGLTRGHFSGSSHIASSRRLLARLRFVTLACDVNDPIAPTIEQLNAFQPNTLSGYSPVIGWLAEAQEAGRLNISPEYVAVGGQPLTKENRQLIERAFGATILNHYGSSEHLTMGIGRASYGGTYLFEDELIFEPDGDQSFVTNLFNYTQPLIRYVMDDRLEILDDPNPVFPFTKIRDLGGRPRPDPVFTNQYGEDDRVSSATFVEFFVPNVQQTQLEALDKNSCVFRVRLKVGLSDPEQREALAAAEKWLTDLFVTKEMENVSRRIEEVEHFGGRKFQLIVTPETATDSTPFEQRPQ